jgi:hypothetical protein
MLQTWQIEQAQQHRDALLDGARARIGSAF